MTLSRQAFLRLLAARLLHVLESTVNPALAALPLFHDGTWLALVENFFDDLPFLQVLLFFIYMGHDCNPGIGTKKKKE